jgi:transcriptional regulator of arginine metabolism
MKNDRQKKIIELVENRCIETQEQLLDQLRQCGFHSTQATVSRDIKELQIVKSLDGMGGYRYCLPHRVEGERFGARFRVIFRECVTNIDYTQNIIVIKTMPGLGAAAGANIDSLKMPNMVGSLSGDDTTLVIMRDKESAAEFCRELHRMLE